MVTHYTCFGKDVDGFWQIDDLESIDGYQGILLSQSFPQFKGLKKKWFSRVPIAIFKRKITM